ncbi:ribosomal silencing factor RsfS [Pseudoclavibacter endophyticus]|uniref:Ribosomal silencing factor RsfS n=1 Tax=Pseudoclavibacter endophyticus TaxID=1778590 RepID=A0A6H9WNH3_9MICO|nr:ribosome silencing factor [Pseudoclavibacter endophyticus]KAB1646805.1 ribosome silencing factor [Pseudoclavibacter endophyticus]GGA75387.1 ribosomal silencing factor RsfS [Pseudoclavibacter endophyticus]
MTASERAVELAKIAAKAADDKQGDELVGLDVSANMPLTDVFLIASGRNERLVLAIAEEIEDQLLEQARQKAIRREGRDEGRWVLLDFGDLIVHVFHEEDRAYYGLERLWRDAPVVDLGLHAAGTSGDSRQE